MSFPTRRGLSPLPLALIMVVCVIPYPVPPQLWGQERDVRNAVAILEQAQQQPVLRVHNHSLNPFSRKLDGQWQGARFASDGQVYFASSAHAHDVGASFFRYDPPSDKLTHLSGDITGVCGEEPGVTPPQGKIHSDVIESNGWVYFCTHLANYWREATAAYTGGHLVGYQFATGRFRDLGVVHPNYSIYSGLGIDGPAQLAYVYVTPFNKEAAARDGAHLHRVHLRTGANEDLGLLHQGSGHSFWFFVAANGDCWLTLGGSNGAMVRATRTGKSFEQFDSALPPRRRQDVDAAAAKQGDRWWRWQQPLGDGRRCVFNMTDCGELYLFDSALAPNWDKAFTAVAHLGPLGLGMAVANERVYYIQRAERKPGIKAADHHLLSVSVAAANLGAIIDHGRIVDEQGRTPWRIESLTADGQGKVFMVGDWRLLPGEKGTFRRDDEKSTASAHVYSELWRGQFFTVADVSADLQRAATQPAPTQPAPTQP